MEFQFHVGAINRKIKKNEQYNRNIFQFHVGAINSKVKY